MKKRRYRNSSNLKQNVGSTPDVRMSVILFVQVKHFGCVV